MSVRTMARVWDMSQHSGTDLLLMLAIADFSDDDGKAYPSVSTLARKCRMQERNCRYILRALEESGELTISPNAGPRGANLYRVNFNSLGVQRIAGLQHTAGRQCIAVTPAMDCREPLQPIAAEPSVNHQEPSTRSRAITGLTMRAFLDQCKREDQKPIPEDDPIFGYADKVGINDEMLLICWEEFKARYLATDKRQKDWHAHFRNAVRRNWYGLWFIKDGEPAQWTTAGEQARRAAA